MTAVPNYRLFAPADHVERILGESPPFSLTAQDIGRLIAHPTRAVVQTLNYLTDNGRVHRRVRGTDPGPDGAWASLPATWGLSGG
jgi:hypothetical protein